MGGWGVGWNRWSREGWQLKIRFNLFVIIVCLSCVYLILFSSLLYFCLFFFLVLRTVAGASLSNI